jgi:hypothetical protein
VTDINLVMHGGRAPDDVFDAITAALGVTPANT